jgi:hypothetical protein
MQYVDRSSDEPASLDAVLTASRLAQQRIGDCSRNVHEQSASLLLGLNFPVRQELLESAIRQRMFHHLLKNREGHCTDMPTS